MALGSRNRYGISEVRGKQLNCVGRFCGQEAVLGVEGEFFGKCLAIVKER